VVGDEEEEDVLGGDVADIQTPINPPFLLTRDKGRTQEEFDNDLPLKGKKGKGKGKKGAVGKCPVTGKIGVRPTPSGDGAADKGESSTGKGSAGKADASTSPLDDSSKGVKGAGQGHDVGTGKGDSGVGKGSEAYSPAETDAKGGAAKGKNIASTSPAAGYGSLGIGTGGQHSSADVMEQRKSAHEAAD